MSILRLKERVPSAVRLGVCFLKQHQLLFHMASEDGSGKCDAYVTGNDKDVVIGALYEMCEDEKIYLDNAESLGYGYDEKIVNVENQSGETFKALIYIALRIDPERKPYSWYLHHVVTGALQIDAPQKYIDLIKSTESIEDHNKNREAQQRAIYNK